MHLRLYRDLAPWYHLIDPAADHADEAAGYADALAGAASGPAETLLELGAGAGNNAVHLKRRFRCTLTDPSEPMLARSGAQNPECEHAAGDMRTLRLGRTFDAVLVHDAVVYMTTAADLRAAAATAFVHTRPGGAALFAPDYVRDTFHEATLPISGDDGARALRGIEWAWDPDPADDTYQVEYALVLRENGQVRVVHDRHVEGLFSRVEWFEVLESVGYQVDMSERPLDDGGIDRVFVCRRVR